MKLHLRQSFTRCGYWKELLGARLFLRSRSWIKCWTASWKGNEEFPERGQACAAVHCQPHFPGQDNICLSATEPFRNNRFRLKDQASAPGLFLLNHTRRGHRGSERLLCALAGKFKVTLCLFQGRGERPCAAGSQAGNAGVRSVYTLLSL